MSRLRARVLPTVALVMACLVSAPAAASVRSHWYRSVDGEPAGVATDHTGWSAVATTTGSWPEPRARVVVYRSTGDRIWRSAWRPTARHGTFGVAVTTGSARIYFVGDVWSPGEADHPTGWFLRTYRRDGELLWSRRSAADYSQGNVGAGVAAWRGGVVTSSSACGEGGCAGGTVSSYALDGSLRWTRSVGSIRGTAEDVAATSGGAVFVTGAFNASSLPIGEGDHPYVSRLRRDGSLAWTRRFAGGGGHGVSIDVRPHGLVVAGVSPSGATTWLASLRADGTERWVRTWRGRRIEDLDVTRAGWIWVTGRERREVGPPALFVRLYRPDGTLATTWRRGPAAGVAAEGTGVSWDHRGVSVVGLWGGEGRIWRLRV